MAVVTLVAGDGTKALPAFTSVQSLAEWAGKAGYPQARPIPVAMETAAAAALQEQAAVLLLDLGGPGQFEVSGRALRAFAQGRTPLPPAVDPEVMDAIKRVLARVPEVAAALDSARLGQAAEDVTVLALGFVAGTDVAALSEPMRLVAEGISADPLLRDRLSGGLQISLAPAARTPAEGDRRRSPGPGDATGQDRARPPPGRTVPGAEACPRRSVHRAGELLARAGARCVGHGRGLAEGQLERAKPVAQRQGVLRADLRRRRGDQPGQRDDQLAGLVQVLRRGGTVLAGLAEAQLHGRRRHQVHRQRRDHLDRGHLGQVARLGQGDRVGLGHGAPPRVTTGHASLARARHMIGVSGVPRKSANLVRSDQSRRHRACGPRLASGGPTSHLIDRRSTGTVPARDPTFEAASAWRQGGALHCSCGSRHAELFRVAGIVSVPLVAVSYGGAGSQTAPSRDRHGARLAARTA